MIWVSRLQDLTTSREQPLDEAYDLVILGRGTAGLIAAGFGVKLGVCVALLEQDCIPGDCTWSRCVPSKTLLEAAKVAHQMRTAVAGEITHGLWPWTAD